MPVSAGTVFQLGRDRDLIAVKTRFSFYKQSLIKKAFGALGS
jgi:hypothetical protein